MGEIEFVGESTVRLIKTNASDEDVCRAAWVSNFGDDARKKLAEPGRQEGLINFLMRERHDSCFEHGSFTFFVDTPLFVAREFMRHRSFSYNETSGRYKELEPRFYLTGHDRPLIQRGKVGSYRFDPGTPEQYDYTHVYTTQAYEDSWGAYQNMLDHGVAREVARNVLPVGIMTQFYATANPRSIMQFLLLRNDPNALAEIREVAEKIEDIFSEQMPLTYAAFKRYDWRDEKVELARLRKRVAQMEAEETYRENINAVRPEYDAVEFRGSPARHNNKLIR